MKVRNETFFILDNNFHLFRFFNPFSPFACFLIIFPETISSLWGMAGERETIFCFSSLSLD
jgi:hypothetical protein